MTLGYRGHDDWRDMSEYVVHFTRGHESDDGYESSIQILGSQRVEARTPLGMARNMKRVTASQASACFSEIPLEYLPRLTDRRQSLYGIAFTKEFVIRSGGGPVWYVEQPSPLGELVDAVKATALEPSFVPDHPFWALTPFIERPGDYDGNPYRFEWEREWRVPNGLAFTPDDVAFLFMPDLNHDRARAFFEGVQRENSGPAYLCPYIDPTWAIEQLQAAFAEVPDFAA